MGLSLQEFIAKQRQLLVMEERAGLVARQLTERKLLKQICSSGSAIPSLRLESVKVGLFGRYLVTFWKGDNVQLPAHKLKPGDTVSIAFVSDYRKPIVTGVVNEIKHTSLSVALETEHPFEQDSVGQESFCLIKMSNDVTHRSLLGALDRLTQFGKFPGGHFVNYLLSSSIPIPCSKNVLLHDFLNKNLNEPQKNAVRSALNPQRPVTLIHGPPGTGKTTVIVEIVRQSLLRGEKILVCAPSNVAVDNIMEKLSKHMLPGSLIRLGHPARLERSILRYSLDSVITTSDDNAILQDVGRFIGKKERKKREKVCSKKTLGGARVICSTLVAAAPNGTLQALEVACWIPLLQAKRCVLVGDHCQLPPTIMSNEAAKNGLSVSLMERILQMFSGQHSDLMCLLSIQYRMNSDIMQWSSSQLYDNKLVAGESVSSHLLSDHNFVDCTEETSASLWLIDTYGCDMDELNLPEESSIANIYEAKLVAIHIEALLAAGVPQDYISVISPYNLQVAILRRLLSSYANINVGSVDGYQGQENDVVVLSLVRSNQQREVGFLADVRRLNVAVTRARRHLCIICDSKTVTKLQFVQTLCDHIKLKGVVKSASRYEGRLNTFKAAGDFSDLIETAKKENVKIVEVYKVKKNVGSVQAKSKERRAVPSFHAEETITLKRTKDTGHLCCGAEEKSEIRLLNDNFMNQCWARSVTDQQSNIKIDLFLPSRLVIFHPCTVRNEADCDITQFLKSIFKSDVFGYALNRLAAHSLGASYTNNSPDYVYLNKFLSSCLIKCRSTFSTVLVSNNGNKITEPSETSVWLEKSENATDVVLNVKHNGRILDTAFFFVLAKRLSVFLSNYNLNVFHLANVFHQLEKHPHDGAAMQSALNLLEINNSGFPLAAEIQGEVTGLNNIESTTNNTSSVASRRGKSSLINASAISVVSRGGVNRLFDEYVAPPPIPYTERLAEGRRWMKQAAGMHATVKLIYEVCMQQSGNCGNDTLLFLCHQTMEIALKAEKLFLTGERSLVHHLDVLSNGSSVKDFVEELIDAGCNYVSNRYPDRHVSPDIPYTAYSSEQATNAVSILGKVMDALKEKYLNLI